ncbi:MAG: hypothetical protein ABI175_11375 [Polyangiales bacterium]
MAYISPRLNARGEKTRDRTRAAASARSSTGSAGGAELFVSLRKIFLPHAPQLVVTADAPGNYSLDTHTSGPNGKPLFFGGVRAGRTCTSFYLMPVYTDPGLLVISEHLRKRMRGKSCFGFMTIEPVLFDELDTLTKRCFAAWKESGKIG